MHGLWSDGYSSQHAVGAHQCFCLLLLAGQLQQLLSLPWAGVLALKRDNLTEPVPVVGVSVLLLASNCHGLLFNQLLCTVVHSTASWLS